MTKTEYVCTGCGSDQVQCTAWVDVNTDEVIAGDPPTDQLYCVGCDEETDIEEVEVTTPTLPADEAPPNYIEPRYVGLDRIWGELLESMTAAGIRIDGSAFKEAMRKSECKHPKKDIRTHNNGIRQCGKCERIVR